LWQPFKQWSFGANYRSGQFDGFWRAHHVRARRPGYRAFILRTNKGARSVPQMATFGVSFRPTSKWNIEVDVDYLNWDKINDLKLQGSGAIFPNDLDLKLNWMDSFQYKLGVTRSFDNGWYVSAGYFYTSETASSQFFTPGVPDTELHVPSVGFGRNGEHWHWRWRDNSS